MPLMKPRAIVAVTNDLSTDQRAHRTCIVLQELGYEVMLVGRLLTGSMPITRPYATHRMRLWFRKGALFYAEYNVRLFLGLLAGGAFSIVGRMQPRGLHGWRMLVANDLDTLLACRLAAGMSGAKLVYDTHEYYTEVPELVKRPIVRRVWLAIERWTFPKLKTVITVNQSIADAYKQRYGNEVQVVRNIPMKRELGPKSSRAELGLPEGKRILIMQGAGINVQRGAEEAVLAMKELPDCLLLIIGGGDAWPVLLRMVKEHALEDRVRLMDRMPYERMMAFTRSADLGLTLDKDTNLNYRFSLPNKLFDYLNAGIPVLATDLPEVARIVRQFEAGVVIPSPEPLNIIGAVNALFADPARKERLCANATFAARALDGDAEKEKLRVLLKNV